MTSTASMTSSPMIYFLAGALLPSLWFLLRKPSSSSSYEGSSRKMFGGSYNSSDEDDKSSDDSSTKHVSKSTGPSSEWGYTSGPYKMVLCVNTELSMGKGKIAAQCCHAAVGCYKRAMKQCPKAVRAWEVSGCAKIALKCPTTDAMGLIATKALKRDIPLYLVEDAGRTQIAAGSRTVLGLGPAPVSAFEGVSSHLKLM